MIQNLLHCPLSHASPPYIPTLMEETLLISKDWLEPNT